MLLKQCPNNGANESEDYADNLLQYVDGEEGVLTHALYT